MNIQSLVATMPSLGLASISLMTWGTIIGIVAGLLSIAYTSYRWVKDIRENRRGK